MCIKRDLSLTKRAKLVKVTCFANAEELLFLGDNKLWNTYWYWVLFQAKGVANITDCYEVILREGYMHAKLEHAFTVCEAFESGYIPKMIGFGYEDKPYVISESFGSRRLESYPYHEGTIDNVYVIGVKPIRRPTLVRT
jgi:hypothetical protein